MTKILITGGAGYLGSVITELLLQDWREITILDNMMYNQTSLINFSHYDNFKFINGDVRDKELLKELVLQNDVIIPLAAIVGFPACERDKELATQINYEHVKFVCDIAKENNKKVVYPNTNSGYGIGENGECTEESPLNPISHYGKTKVEAEKEVLGIGGISLRLATVFGTSPRMRMDLLVNEFVYKALTDKSIVLFEKKFVRNFIHIRDVALVFRKMINQYEQWSGMVFNVGLSEANLTKQQLCEVIQEQVPSFQIFYNDNYEDPDKRDYIVSNALLESCGWRPRYTLEKGIEELIKTYTIMISNLSSNYRNDFPLGYGIK
jgi:nucleoside-diphosphate-sugar epimerase